MQINTDDMLKRIAESISEIDYIHPGDVPNIELYMDQITTFMDTQLDSTKRYGEDKILTKTMINNYVKNNLLPPPVKKKYTKEHILVLIFIYYFKNILSIKDIETILSPITKKAFAENPSLDINDLYEKICKLESSQIDPLKEELNMHYAQAEELFPDNGDEDQDYLRIFALICGLSFDVYMKKYLIEKIVDNFCSPDSE